jgi:hypothetical protein
MAGGFMDKNQNVSLFYGYELKWPAALWIKTKMSACFKDKNQNVCLFYG